MHSTHKTFNYKNKKWGITNIDSFYTKFQGLELSYFLKDIPSSFKKNPITSLDLGCGGGNIPGFFKIHFPKWHVLGVDIAKDAINMGKKRFPKVKFILSDVKKLPFKDNSIDLLTGFDSLEHFPKLENVLDEASRVLRKNGVFYVAIPLEKQFPTFYWILYKLGWRGKRDFAGHINFFNNKEFISLMKSHGFMLEKKRYSYHLIFSIFDIVYYASQILIGKQATSFESSVEELDSGIKKSIIVFFKNALTVTHYFESSIFNWFPGGKGHYVFVNKKTKDFFSIYPPVTILEGHQAKIGLKKILRPKDLAFKNCLYKNNFPKSRRILDFGCANGIWLERILNDNRKASGIGIDISNKLIEEANQRTGKRGSYVCNIMKWPKFDKSFDYCISLDVFEHIVKKEKEVKKIYSKMIKGGKIVFFTLNPNNKYTFDWLFEKMGSDYLYKRADHKKEVFISPSSFSKMLKRNGFNNVEYSLYAGPANLFWDIAAYIYLPLLGKVLNKVHLYGLIPFIVGANDKLLRLIFPLNNFIDGFFFRRGYSNGYFIWGEK